MAFTAYYLNTVPSRYSIHVFERTYINSGNGYDTSTGKFTCKIPGVYHFSVTLLKEPNKRIDFDPKLLYKGGHLHLYWYTSGKNYNMNEVTPLTQSATFHLNKGDVVHIQGIPDHFYTYGSTFTGFLITPD